VVCVGWVGLFVKRVMTPKRTREHEAPALVTS
jgi:hypothetical protein